MILDHDTIAAPATAAGGAIGVVRISGDEAIGVCDRIFRGRQPLSRAKGYTVHYGRIVDGERIVDDVLATVFRSPHSYTGEDSVEIACHGSSYILSEVLRLLCAAGARMAEPGEFTTRAYLAGKMDLAQAEAVADLIASSSRAAHALASTQMRGGYSAALASLREELIRLTSLLELELDFGEEDVEFADRNALRDTMQQIGTQIDLLSNSFSLGNAIKEGVAVAIVGAPNVGKSTLLNRLLGEERAMVSDIAGTTRDTIEQTANIDGVLFRFIDTAGIRPTNDRLEQMGIERTMQSIERAQIVVRMYDAAGVATDATTAVAADAAAGQMTESNERSGIILRPGQIELCVVNKTDTATSLQLPPDAIGISAKHGVGIEHLRAKLRASVDTRALYHGDAVVSSNRHYEALTAARTALNRALAGLGTPEAIQESHVAIKGGEAFVSSSRNGLPTDLLSEEIRQVIHHIGAITGDITSDDVLQHIFSKFCIGK